MIIRAKEVIIVALASELGLDGKYMFPSIVVKFVLIII